MSDTPSEQSLAYIRQAYRVPAHRGGFVRVDGRHGVIRGGRDAHLVVEFEGETLPCHPTWRVEYVELTA